MLQLAVPYVRLQEAAMCILCSFRNEAGMARRGAGQRVLHHWDAKFPHLRQSFAWAAGLDEGQPKNEA